jgi:hypothetical protein
MGWSDHTGLVDSNGDAEMWLRLCNLDNRQFVRALNPKGGWTATTTATSLISSGAYLYWAASPTGQDWYGANPVMDQLGNVHTGMTPDNLFPMCVPKPTVPAQLQIAQQALQASPISGTNAVIPFCPDGFLTADHQLQITGDGGIGSTDFVDGVKWAARGAINAALAVFLYLDQIEHDPTQRQPLYTQCNLIGGAK